MKNTNGKNDYVTTKAKVTSFTPVYVKRETFCVKRETASRRVPFYVNVMLNLSVVLNVTLAFLFIC